MHHRPCICVIDMCVDICLDKDMCVCADIGMCRNVHGDMCIDMCIDICRDMCIDMCIDVYRHVYGLDDRI